MIMVEVMLRVKMIQKQTQLEIRFRVIVMFMLNGFVIALLGFDFSYGQVLGPWLGESFNYISVWLKLGQLSRINVRTQSDIYIYIYIYITNLVCYAYFHWLFNPECQHIFQKQTGYICTFSVSLIWASKNNNNVVDKNRNIYASLNQYHNTE